MADTLSFTPSFTHTYYDTGKTLKIVIDYSDFPDYDDFSAMTVRITGANTSTDSTVDIYSNVVTSLTGTVTASIGDSTLTGSGTLFSTEIAAGDYITFGDDTDAIYLVSAVNSATEIVLTSPLVASLTSSSAKKYAGAIYLIAADLGQTAGGTISDDVYTFLYTLTFASTTDEYGTYEQSESLTCNINCYVQGLIAGLPDSYNCVNCSDTYLTDTSKVYFYYKALNASAYNGSLDHYNTILAALCDIKDLTTSNCGCS